jgi:hypothetical protein
MEMTCHDYLTVDLRGALKLFPDLLDDRDGHTQWICTYFGHFCTGEPSFGTATPKLRT